jgi:hypothetical protein
MICDNARKISGRRTLVESAIAKLLLQHGENHGEDHLGVKLTTSISKGDVDVMGHKMDGCRTPRALMRGK